MVWETAYFIKEESGISDREFTSAILELAAEGNWFDSGNPGMVAKQLQEEAIIENVINEAQMIQNKKIREEYEAELRAIDAQRIEEEQKQEMKRIRREEMELAEKLARQEQALNSRRGFNSIRKGRERDKKELKSRLENRMKVESGIVLGKRMMKDGFSMKESVQIVKEKFGLDNNQIIELVSKL